MKAARPWMVICDTECVSLPMLATEILLYRLKQVDIKALLAIAQDKEIPVSFILRFRFWLRATI